MYIICLFPFILVIVPAIGALIGRTLDKRIASEISNQSFENFSAVVGNIISFFISIITFFSGFGIEKPSEYKPKRREISGILIGLILDIPIFLWLMANASAM